jgi:hypothetical protein
MAIAPDRIRGHSPPTTPYRFCKCCEAVLETVPIAKAASGYADLEPLGGKAWFAGCCPLPGHDDKRISRECRFHEADCQDTGRVEGATRAA